MSVLSFMQLGPPGLLDAVSRPEDLLHPRRPLECHGGVEGWLGGARHQGPHLDIVNEGDVIRRVPVQAVVTLGEGHRVQQQVDGGHHLGHDMVTSHGWVFICFTHILAILLGRAVLYCQTAADEIVLNVNYHKSRCWLYYFLDPLFIHLVKLLNAHTAVSACVEYVEHISYSLRIETEEKD